MKTTEAVIGWFGNRGYRIESACLLWHWEDGRLWFILSGQKDDPDIYDTDLGMVDMTKTHRDDGSPISIYELWDSVPVDEAPLAFRTLILSNNSSPQKRDTPRNGI